MHCDRLMKRWHAARRRLQRWLALPLYFGRTPATVQSGALIFFPLCPNRFCCGLAGIVAFKWIVTHMPILTEHPEFRESH